MPSPEISPELEDLVIRRLAETANRDKVIKELCAERGMLWSDASQMVDDLIRAHELDISWRQSPLLMLIVLFLFVGGIFLIGLSLGLFGYLVPDNFLAPIVLISAWFHVNPFFSLSTFITGLAMIAGSYLGMRNVWASFFECLDQRKK